MPAPYVVALRPLAATIFALGVLTGCPEKKDEQACGVNLHGDDVLCGNGHIDPGEICLSMETSLPVAKYMYKLHNLTLADFNGDNHVDLRIGSDIYTGVGDGTFSETFIRTSGSIDARDVAAGDFNGDGITDLAYVSYDINIFDDPGLADDRKLLTLWTGNSALNPIQARTFSALFFDYPANIVAADFNEDNIDDLAISQISWDLQHCDAKILLRDLTLPIEQSFADVGRVPGVNGALGCRLAPFDIDADGHWDLDTTLETFSAGTGTGEFKQKATRRPVAVAAAHGHDLNCDGVPDAIGLTEKTTQIWQGMGKGEFKIVNPELTSGDAIATIAELNSDGEPDVLAAGSLGLRVFLGDTDFSFSDGTLLSDYAGYTELAVADINEDGQLDLVALGASGVDIFVSHP